MADTRPAPSGADDVGGDPDAVSPLPTAELLAAATDALSVDAGPADLDPASGRRISRRATVLGAVACGIAATFASAVVVALLVLVLPVPEGVTLVSPLTVALAAAYYLVASVGGVVTGLRRTRRRLDWLRAGRVPTDRERRRTIGIPFAVARLQAVLWFGAAVLFAVVTAPQSGLLALEVGVTVLIGGLTSSATSYLAVEAANRPVIAHALAHADVSTSRGAGVAWRAVTVWTLGTALPVVGLVVLAGLAVPLGVPRDELALAAFVLGIVTIVSGAAITLLAARSVAHPLKALRVAIRRLAAGERDVAVRVTDAGEIGILQTAFNQLSAGLAERDELRDLFGLHVGEEVARRALREGVALGGEVRDVAVLYVDVTGSTALAEHTGPQAVVDQLNVLFTAVTAAVEREGGTVTTFAGDAAVCVWGAPVHHPDPGAAALRAARDLAQRLAASADAPPVGIGVAAGPVVAGNVGSPHRLEYTVIGDAVNCAARLSDLAKQRGTLIVAAAELVPTGSDEWQAAGSEVLRGRSTPTDLVVARTV